MRYVLKNDRGVRAFLNGIGSPDTGHVQGLVEKPQYPDGPWEIELAIGDCSRTVTLHFDCGNEEEQDEALRKMQRLIDAAQHMQELIRNVQFGD